MASAIRLRAWQRAALSKLERCPHRNFLAVATPGAGKTTFALTAVRRSFVARQVNRLVVVVPTQHLKVQWADAAEAFDIHLDPFWSAGDGLLPSDVHGVAVTYQQVAASPGSFRRLAQGAFVVLDEIHHAADSRSWGDGVRTAFEGSALRLCLSGTPFRSDQSTIPFVRYDGELAEPDFEYGYGDALADTQVVRPIYFPRINGRMEWTAPDGQHYSASFDDRLSRVQTSQRLRTALDLEGEWLPAVLEQAHAQLLHLRRQDPRAGGLIIAMDQDHADGIARNMRDRLGVKPVVAVSDDPGASNKIGAFADSDEPWIVAVRMVSEGVDLPRLRVGVYATNTATDLFFRQAVGRLVRWSGRLDRQTAYMFIPDDARLRSFAFGIAEQRRHSLKKPDCDEREGPEDADEEGEEGADEEQMSLFSAISAIPMDRHGKPLCAESVIDDAESSDAHTVPADQSQLEGDLEDLADEIPDWVGSEGDPHPTPPPFELTAPDAGSGEERLPVPEPLLNQPPDGTPRARKRWLREANSARVRTLAHATRRGHADVNAELNRRAGIKRVTEASLRDLQRRLDLADHWLRRL